MERQECQPHKQDLEPKSFKEQREAKYQKEGSRDIHKMIKPSKLHGKDNMTPKDVMSLLKALEELFVKDYEATKCIGTRLRSTTNYERDCSSFSKT
jgi:hypothetical protein